MFQTKLNELRGAKLEGCSVGDDTARVQKPRLQPPESIVDEWSRKRSAAEFGDRVTRQVAAGKGITLRKIPPKDARSVHRHCLAAKNISSEIMISPHKVENYYLAHKTISRWMTK